MKKILLLSAIMSIVFLSCNQNPLKPGPGAPGAQFQLSDSIPRPTALQMIKYYRDSLRVDRSLDNSNITLEISDLNEIFKLDSVTRIRFFRAAYPDNYEDKDLRNKVTVLLQLKHGYHSGFSYYSGAVYLCPPPPCPIE